MMVNCAQMALMALSFAVGDPGSDESKLLERFHAEAPIAWKEPRAFSNASRGTVYEVSEPQADEVKESPVWKVRFEWNCRDANDRMQVTADAGDPRQVGSVTVYAANHRYGFIAMRRH